MISFPTSLSLSLTVALIIASASAKSMAAENCELGASCENEIEDDEDDFGFYWDEEDDGFEYEDDASNLPPCSELTYFEVELGTACTNETVIPEVRLNDVLSERLIRQVWLDIRAKLKDDGEFRGMMIDPLILGAIDVRQKTSAYSADVKMSGIQLLGLSTIRLDEASVTRDENLTDLHIGVKIGFDELTITGQYDLKGTFGWWELDSNGTRDFEINLYGVSYASKFNFEMVGESEGDGRCVEGDVVISEMGFPLRYDAVNFRFDNLGPFVNSMASGIGGYFIQMQEDSTILEIKKVIRKEVSSLLC